MDRQLLEYVYHLFPNPTTVKLKFVRSDDDMSLVMHQNIAILFIHYKGKTVNVIDETIIHNLGKMIGDVERLVLEGKIHGLLLYSLKKDCFIAGADVNMIYTITDRERAKTLSRTGQLLTRRIEYLPIVVLAAIHGVCLGAGFELCLAASHRVCSNHSKTYCGLPETKIGILTACGGCVRLPRLIGLDNSIQMILQGSSVGAKSALSCGIVDQVFPYESTIVDYQQQQHDDGGDNGDGGEEFISKTKPQTPDVEFFQRSFEYIKDLSIQTTGEREELIAEAMKDILQVASTRLFNREPSFQLQKYKKRKISIREYLKDNPIGRLFTEFIASNNIKKQTRGRPFHSPHKILETIIGGYTASIDQALEIEACNFAELVIDPVSKNLISLFNMLEAAKKADNFCDPQFCHLKIKQVIRRIAVIGSGQMGCGITQLCLSKGYNVYLKEVEYHYLENGLKRIKNELFSKQIHSGKVTENQRDEVIKKLLETGLKYDPIEDCQMVIEAALERIDIKKEVLERAQEFNKNIIFATNTSSIPLTSIAEESNMKQNVIGLHFFNPANEMPLVEIIATRYTSQEVLAKAYQFALDLGKIPIVVNDSPGFLTTRLFVVYCIEATSIVLDGVPFEEIDQRLQEFGFSTGVLSMMDHNGLDVAIHVMPILAQNLALRFDHYEALKDLVKGGNVGVKNRKGFYLYDEFGRPTGGVNPEALKIISRYQAKRERKVNLATLYDDIVDRCILVLINEASKCIEEGIIALPEAVDISMIMGFGFPSFLGGLLSFADTLGIANIVKRLEELSMRYDSVKMPSKLLVDMAKSKHHFFPERVVLHSILAKQQKHHQHASKL